MQLSDSLITETDNSWTARSLLACSVACLTEAGVGSPHLDAEVLLAGALRSRREDIRMTPDRMITEGELTVAKDYIGRRARREPVSYILRRKEFWSLDFKVSPDVLVPRPETEVLIERLLERVTCREHPYRILDVGTGCGVIAIVVAKELPNSRVTAIDISTGALRVAGENAENHKVLDRIEFVSGNIFPVDPCGVFDYILTNPPYIETQSLGQLMPDVRDYEPGLALDGGIDGLDYYRRIIPGAYQYLAEGGALILEIGENQAERVSDLFRMQGGYRLPVVSRDYSGRDRIVLAERL